jgi:hypothetical protein
MLNGTMSNTPVLVELHGHSVSILELARTRIGVVMVDGRSFMNIGEVKKGSSHVKGVGMRTAWRWRDVAGSSGEASTKANAIRDMLDYSGFVQAPLTITIPDLLAGLE